MTLLDVSFCRSQFPPFEDPELREWAFFENAGGSYSPQAVVDRLQTFYSHMKLQPYYAYGPSTELGAGMDSSLQRLATAVNASVDEIVLSSSSSQNVFVLAKAIGEQIEPGDEIILSEQDHETNIGAWARLAERGATIRWWRPDPELGLLQLGELDKLLTERTRLVCVTHCSNVAGTTNPVAAIVARSHAVGARVMIDGVAHAPHGLPDMQATGADFYIFSLYKTYSVHQGLMFVRREHLDTMANQGHFFNSDKTRKLLDPAGPDHGATFAAAGMLDYFQTLFRHHFEHEASDDFECAKAVSDLFISQEQRLLERLMGYLLQRTDIRVIGAQSADRAVRVPTIAFSIDGVDPDTIAAQLAARKIGMGVGNFYSYRLLQRLNIDPDSGLARISAVHYNTVDEVDRLINALERIRA